MKRFKKHLILAAVLAGLAIAGTMMNPHPASAGNPVPGSSPVNIVSPVPLPTTVSGPVAATQSGTWNVGVNGTPTVNLAAGTVVSLPTHLGVPPGSASAPNIVNIAIGTSCGHQFCQINPDGTSSTTAFVIPPKHFLVVTDIMFALSGGGESANLPQHLVLTVGGNQVYDVFVVADSQGLASANVHLTSGLLLSTLPDVGTPVGQMQGYLVSQTQ